MEWIRKTASMLLLIAAAGASQAGEHAYVCTVEHVYDVSDFGKMIESELDDELEGARFAVSREDGRILGEVLATTLAESTRVIDRGTDSHSFKSVADFGDRVQVLEIKQHGEGESKPFMALSTGGSGIVSGVCR